MQRRRSQRRLQSWGNDSRPCSRRRGTAASPVKKAAGLFDLPRRGRKTVAVVREGGWQPMEKKEDDGAPDLHREGSLSSCHPSIRPAEKKEGSGGGAATHLRPADAPVPTTYARV